MLCPAPQCKVSEDYAKAYIKTEDVDDGKK